MWPFFLLLSASFDTYEVTMAATLHLTGRTFTTALCIYCKMTTRIVLLYLAGRTYIPFTLIQMFEDSLNVIVTLQILNLLTLQILDLLLLLPTLNTFYSCQQSPSLAGLQIAIVQQDDSRRTKYQIIPMYTATLVVCLRNVCITLLIMFWGSAGSGSYLNL